MGEQQETIAPRRAGWAEKCLQALPRKVDTRAPGGHFVAVSGFSPGRARETIFLDGIYRISTFVPEVGPDGFTFNQFLLDAEEPLLYHTGMKGLFPLVSQEVARVRPLEQLRRSHRGRRRPPG